MEKNPSAVTVLVTVLWDRNLLSGLCNISGTLLLINWDWVPWSSFSLGMFQRLTSNDQWYTVKQMHKLKTEQGTMPTYSLISSATPTEQNKEVNGTPMRAWNTHPPAQMAVWLPNLTRTLFIFSSSPIKYLHSPPSVQQTQECQQKGAHSTSGDKVWSVTASCFSYVCLMLVYHYIHVQYGVSYRREADSSPKMPPTL